MKSNVQTERRDGQNLRRQSAMGLLLLLTLLLANPPQGQAQNGYINFNSDVGVDLYSYFGPSVHNVTVNSGYTIDNTSDGLYAIYGEYQPWHLINNGTLNAYWYGSGGVGVDFEDGGSVNNTGNIYGTYDGIDIYGDSGSVVNSGNIIGSWYNGIYFDHGGSVNNLFGGNIYGEGNEEDGGAGVAIYGGAGLVNNAGTITSYYGLDAIYMDQGGSITNSGNIYGSGNGLEIYGGAGSVVNTGNIYGYDGTGVYIDQTGSVSNSGGIYGYANGVAIGGSGYVVNNGWIAGGYDEGPVGVNHVADGSDESLAGVYLGGGGVVVNQTNGVIIGGYDYGTGDGVYITGGFGFVTNSGYIHGNGDDGVEFTAGGVVNNLGGGFIGGGVNGLDINGPAIVFNAGTISGEGNVGIYLNQGGSVSNQTGGSISGYFDGVEIYGAPGIVYNSGGSIIGTNGDGVYMDQGGTVVNKRTWSWENGVSVASIEGGVNGVEISGGSGFVTNSGSITGDNGNGIKLNNGGIVDNKKHGFIGGNTDGVAITNGWGYVINTGVIIGTNNAGVHMHDGGLVVNQTKQSHGNNSGYGDEAAAANNSQFSSSSDRGIIQGGTYGVEISGDIGYVTNSGSITGDTRDGVRLWDGGLVVNQSQENNWGGYGNTPTYNNGNNNPTIAGNTGGVKITGGEGLVINSGTIWGTNNDGVYLGDGGSVYNKRNGTISGGNNGVEIYGDTGYVSNEGNISSAPTLISSSPTVSSAGIQAPIGGNGVYMDLGGTVDNKHHGTISGTINGVEIEGGQGYVSNDGDISSEIITPDSVSSSGKSIALISGSGVYLGDGGTVDNKGHGSIEGYDGYGIQISGGAGVVENSGYIYGGNGIAILLDNYSNSVTLKTGSDVEGDIVGGITGTNVAILQGHGTFGYNFTNFQTLTMGQWGNNWNLTGNSTFSSNVTVLSGLLRINGELTTPLLIVSNTVDNLRDAGLGGSGVINGIVDNYGYISPGNSPGTLTIIGSLTNSGDYYADLPPTGNYDQILVSGTTTINGGWVYGQLTRQIYGSNTVYILLTSTNGVTGTYDGSSITPNLFLSSTLLYDANDVYLDLRRSKFSTVAQTYNQNEDRVIGSVAREGVSVHREDCANAIALAADEKERLIEVEWDEDRTGVFVAAIEVKALDRNRLLADVAKVLSEHHVSIISSSTHTTPDRVSRMRFEFELADPEHLDSLLENLRLLDSVYDAYRLVPGRSGALAPSGG